MNIKYSYKKIMDTKKKEEILKKSASLSSKISETLDKKTEHISSVRYYEDFFFSGANIEENNVYIVEIKSQNLELGKNKRGKNKEISSQIGEDVELELTTYEIYDENQNLIATVDAEGNVSFSEEYIAKLETLPPEYYDMLDLSATDFSLQEMTEKDMEVSAKDIEKYEEKNKKINFDKEEKEAAETIGIEEENLRTLAVINPHTLVTANETLGQIIPELNKYSEVQISCEKSDNQNDGRFTMIGVNEDGTKEQVQSVGQVGGINTGRTVTSINRDGTEVKEKEVKGLFQIAGRPEEGISISVGDYNIPEVQYIQNMNDKENRQAIPIGVKSRYDNYVYHRVREEANRNEGLGTQEKDGEIEQRTEMVRESEKRGETEERTIDGTDADLEKIKEQIIEKALDKYEDLSPSELTQYIREELESYDLIINNSEKKQVITEVRIRVEDEARAFQTRERRGPNEE